VCAGNDRPTESYPVGCPGVSTSLPESTKSPNSVLAINDETIIVINMYFVAALLSDEVTMVIIDWAIMVFMFPNNGIYFGFQRMIVKLRRN
jgi:hypothetical protein